MNLAREPNVEQTLFADAGALREVRDGVLLLTAIERLKPALQDRLVEELAKGVSCRLLSTTGPDLALAFAEERFRLDLFARLSSAEIPIPPLSERKEDAVWLLHALFADMNAKRGQPLKGISSLAEEAVRAHDWPDNGREVRNRLERALSLASEGWILPADLFPERQSEQAFRSLVEVRETAERDQIVAALERTDGQVAAAAKLLRISRTTLWEKMQKLDLQSR
ncbi:MAG: helix-turn-helix domain-containing protein [Kiloniellales bacterium]